MDAPSQSPRTGERLLVCVSPSPLSRQLLHGARRMVAALNAREWIAIYVEPPAGSGLSAPARERVTENLRLAEQLGAETAVLSASNAAEETIRYARVRGVTKVVVGKPTHARVWDRVRPSFLERIVRSSGEIDVYVLAGEDETPRTLVSARVAGLDWSPLSLLAAALSAALSTGIASTLFSRQQLPDVVMIYLLGIVLVAMRFGYGPSLLAAVLGVLCFDFFFIPPYYTLAVGDLSHIATFGVMFLVAAVISGLTQRVREQAHAARLREQRTASLYALSRELAASRQVEEIASVAGQRMMDALGLRCSLFVPAEGKGELRSAVGHPDWFDASEQRALEAAWGAERAAGLTTQTLSMARALYLPLSSGRGKLAVLGVHPDVPSRLRNPETRQHLNAFANQVANAIERTLLAADARRAELQMETEQLRNSLLSSVSHDLRTPLAVMTGAASTLIEDTLAPPVRRELTETILQEAQRLNRLVRNLLDMTRLEAGALRVNKEWQPLEEVVGSALNRLDDLLKGRAVCVALGNDLPLVPFDAVLIEQVLVNLLENAAKYTPPGSPLEIRAQLLPQAVELELMDRGPGLPAGQEQKIFEKFQRGQAGQGGVGLGLAICKGIVIAHGGQLVAENRAGGGATFRFRLPIDGEPPELDVSEPALEAAERTSSGDHRA